MSKQTVEEAAKKSAADIEIKTDADRTHKKGFIMGFGYGAAWQKERYKDMLETLQELLCFKHVMIDSADTLQYPDNFLKAIENAKTALCKALD